MWGTEHRHEFADAENAVFLEGDLNDLCDKLTNHSGAHVAEKTVVFFCSGNCAQSWPNTKSCRTQLPLLSKPRGNFQLDRYDGYSYARNDLGWWPLLIYLHEKNVKGLLIVEEDDMEEYSDTLELAPPENRFIRLLHMWNGICFGSE